MLNKNSIQFYFRHLLSIVSFYSGICSFSVYLRRSQGARILCFHGINDAPSNRYAVSASDFSQQMRFLTENYEVVSIGRLVELYQTNQKLHSKLVAVSFDDGYDDFYVHGFPTLQQYGIPATVFLPTGSIDGDSILIKVLPQKKFLSWNRIREMHQNGIDFGSHSVSHRSLTMLKRREVQYELEHSKAQLEANLGIMIPGFSYPYGTLRDTHPEIGKMINSAGYLWAVTCISGVNGARMNPFALRRTVIMREDGLAGFKRALRGALDGWIVMQMLGYVMSRFVTKNRNPEWNFVQGN